MARSALAGLAALILLLGLSSGTGLLGTHDREVSSTGATLVRAQATPTPSDAPTQPAVTTAVLPEGGDVQRSQPPAQPLPVSPPSSTGARSAGPAALASPSPAPAAPRTLVSTAYCETGRMASGPRTYFGAAAMAEPFGSRWLVLSGSFAGQVFTAADHYGRGTQMDIALPGECGRARQYGRQVIRVQRIG